MKLAIALLLAVFASPAFAADNFCDTGKPHPIDVWFEQAMDQAGGITTNIRTVQAEAYSRWDKELNRVYSELLTKLKASDRSRLRQAQSAWVRFRDAEIKWLWSRAMYGEGGTLAPVVISDIGRGLLKERVCQLQRYKNMAYGRNP
ncbi:MAG TPA: lysozyme inhibitor LprI family protein [Pyrinomonadaceae bacterium]|nr:lysozyme inhibitor LprI family protein [Pyrinomonadaceae bacterium]